ncbi:MAG: response regulator transcription factor [Spirochaetales bacterium]|nr:response regulator transcription factor [Spirochaetales bacterium]
MAKASILVIEDEKDIQEIISFNLEREGYTVMIADNAEKGLDIMRKVHPDLVLLDMMLPGIDGFEALRKIKADRTLSQCAVFMVTARSEDADIVAGFELGADDYVTKPFSPKVLIARIRSRLREVSSITEEAKVLTSHGIALDPVRHEVCVEGESLSLSVTEFALLEHFMENPGHVFSRQRLIDAVRGQNYQVTDRAVDVQILGLRKKLGSRGDYIETVRGIGYRWKEERRA